MDDLKEMGAIPLKMDITKEKDVVTVAETILKKHNRLDILINNAGLAVYGSAEEIPMEIARYQFEVNLFGLARLTQLFLPQMRERKAGKIINISSVTGKVGVPLGSWYISSKFALEGWSDSLRTELNRFNIDVIIIEAGGIKTEIYKGVKENLQKYSGSGPYKEDKEAVDKFLKETVDDGFPPSVISKLIIEAIRSKEPKTRYVGGKSARLFLFLKNWLSDKLFDKILYKLVLNRKK